LLVQGGAVMGGDMRGILRVLLAASATIVVWSAAATAADMPVKAVPAPAKIEYGNLYFGMDWTSHKSLAGYTGVLYAPNGMHQSGWRLSAFGLVGRYQYQGGDNNETFKGNFVSTDALVGWSHVFQNGAVTIAGGVNYQNHRVSPVDLNNPVSGSKLGAKIQADIWMNPTERTLVYALGSNSTAFHTYYSIGRLGYDFTQTGSFFGPEIGALGNDRTDQLRIGLHLTALKLGSAKLTMSGGWMHERGQGDGGYAAASVDFGF